MTLWKVFVLQLTITSHFLTLWAIWDRRQLSWWELQYSEGAGHHISFRSYKKNLNLNYFNYCVYKYFTLVALSMNNYLNFCQELCRRWYPQSNWAENVLRSHWRKSFMSKSVWGDCGTKDILITYLINCYDHWIYYHSPDLRFCWNWITSFLQILIIIKSNS